MRSYLELAKQALEGASPRSSAAAVYERNEKNERSHLSTYYERNEKNERSQGRDRTDGDPSADLPAPAPDPAPGAEPPLEAAVRFDIPGVGDVWLVPDASAAEKLGIPAGRWLTPADLALLDGLAPDERVQVLRWMRRFGGRLTAAPAPAKRYGPGERGWNRWRLASIDHQIAEYRREKGGPK